MTLKSKKTATLTLVLIASVSFTACQANQKRSREVYRNLSDCSLEWGGADKCEPVRDGSYPVWYYYGPHYSHRRGRLYYYPSTGTQPQLVPNSAGILNNSQRQPTLSVREDTSKSENTTSGSGSTTRNRPSVRSGSKTFPSSGRVNRSGGKTTRGGFGSGGRSGSRGG